MNTQTVCPDPQPTHSAGSCPLCVGRRYVYATPQPVSTWHSALSYGDMDAVARERQSRPRVRCPNGCEPWKWDRERLAADAVRLGLVAEAA